jgi:hypothetical protein
VSTWRGALALLADHAELFALEAKRASVGLAVVIMCGVLAAILISAAWLTLIAVGVRAAVLHGLDYGSAGLLAVALNGLVVWLLYAVARQELTRMCYPRTVAQLRVAAAADAPALSGPTDA